MANLLFRPAQIQQELEALKSLTEGFLDPKSYRLDELADDIRGAVTQTGRCTLEIPEARPLQTRTSVGEFERANKSSKRPIYATLSGIWKINVKKQKLPNPERPNKKPKDVLLVGFTGLASTVTSVYDVGVAAPIARWQMDLGDANAPGCFFHTHAFAPAHHSFPVPRYPNLFPTPMSAIGFALGELFQDAWEQAVSGSGDPPKRWRSIQADRLERLLKWQNGLVAEATASPWLALKAAKPKPTLFV